MTDNRNNYFTCLFDAACATMDDDIGGESPVISVSNEEVNDSNIWLGKSITCSTSTDDSISKDDSNNYDHIQTLYSHSSKSYFTYDIHKDDDTTLDSRTAFHIDGATLNNLTFLSSKSYANGHMNWKTFILDKDDLCEFGIMFRCMNEPEVLPNAETMICSISYNYDDHSR